ncbi:MAG: hypothetical protein QM752_02605 [Gammaproteobacteria bacterium]
MPNIEPAVVTAADLALCSLCLLVINNYLEKVIFKSLWNFFQMFCYLMISIYFFIISALNLTSVTHESLSNITLSFIFIFIAAIALYMNNLAFKNLHKLNFKPKEAVAIRFPLLIFISLWVTIAHGKLSWTPITQFNWGFLLLILSYGVIPLYFIQVSIKKLNLQIITFVTALLPLVTYLFQLAFGSYKASSYSLNGIFALSIISILNCILHVAKRRPVRQQIQPNADNIL